MDTMEDEGFRQRLAKAEPQFAGQEVDIANITEELYSVLDVYTPEGGNLLGTKHVEYADIKAVVSFLSTNLTRPDEVRVRGEIDFGAVTGEQYRITVERVV